MAAAEASALGLLALKGRKEGRKKERGVGKEGREEQRDDGNFPSHSLTQPEAAAFLLVRGAADVTAGFFDVIGQKSQTRQRRGR